MTTSKPIPAVSFQTARTGASTNANERGMRPMQEHALTVGYRSSLTEIIQIIGRATRDAPGKESATFTNLIAEPDASEAAVVGAINDTLKAIAASLLMEQVLAPRFTFTPKGGGPLEDFDYDPAGYKEGETNVGVREGTGHLHFEIKGLVEPKSDEAQRICKEDLNEVITQFVQDKTAMEKGLFDGAQAGGETLAQELMPLSSGPTTRRAMLASMSRSLEWRTRAGKP